MRHVLFRGDLGSLTLVWLRPWHRMLARCAAARLDRELAAGTSPETSISLAARAVQLTSGKSRRVLATSLQRILAAAGEQLAQCHRGLMPFIRHACRCAGPGSADRPGRSPRWPAI